MNSNVANDSRKSIYTIAVSIFARLFAAFFKRYASRNVPFPQNEGYSSVEYIRLTENRHWYDWAFASERRGKHAWLKPYFQLEMVALLWIFLVPCDLNQNTKRLRQMLHGPVELLALTCRVASDVGFTLEPDQSMRNADCRQTRLTER